MIERYRKDYEFIQKLCDALEGSDRKKKKELFAVFYSRYIEYFKELVPKFVNKSEREDIINGFFCSLLEDPRKLKNYRGEALFQTYISKLFYYFRCDRFKNENRDMVASAFNTSSDTDNINIYDVLSFYKDSGKDKLVAEIKNTEQVHEKTDFKSLVMECLSKTLLDFSLQFPEDGRILTLELQGMERKQIANTLNMKINTLNQKIKRDHYGIHDRFKRLFIRKLHKEYNIGEDLIKENFSVFRE